MARIFVNGMFAVAAFFQLISALVLLAGLAALANLAYGTTPNRVLAGEPDEVVIPVFTAYLCSAGLANSVFVLLLAALARRAQTPSPERSLIGIHLHSAVRALSTASFGIVVGFLLAIAFYFATAAPGQETELVAEAVAITPSFSLVALGLTTAVFFANRWVARL